VRCDCCDSCASIGKNFFRRFRSISSVGAADREVDHTRHASARDGMGRRCLGVDALASPHRSTDSHEDGISCIRSRADESRSRVASSCSQRKWLTVTMTEMTVGAVRWCMQLTTHTGLIAHTLAREDLHAAGHSTSCCCGRPHTLSTANHAAHPRRTPSLHRSCILLHLVLVHP
jgi:hypothetical protein